MVRALYFVMAHVGVLRLFYWINRGRPVVLTYHNVLPDSLFDDTLHVGVSHRESVFACQIRLIRRRFRATDAGARRCVITFDDGYRNQLEVAARILNEHELQGVFFIPFLSVTTGAPLTIDRLLMWLSYVPAGVYTVLGDSVAIDDRDRSAAASRILPRLWGAYESWDVLERDLNAAFPFAALRVDPELERLRFEPLQPDDLTELTRQGHLVAAHSWSHRPLGTLPVQTQREEFVACRDAARQYCNSLLFSYPFGEAESVTPTTAALCEAHGFSAGYMNVPELPAWPGTNDQYILPRLSLPNETNAYVLDAKLSGFEAFCKRVVRRRARAA